MLELFDLEPKDRLISQLMLSHGLLSAEQLKATLARARESVFFSLAEIVIGQGLITLEALERLLMDYCRKLRLGELALAKGLITEHQLEIALAMQAQSGEARIGEIFVELHFATAHQIEMLVEFQGHCRVQAAAV